MPFEYNFNDFHQPEMREYVDWMPDQPVFIWHKEESEAPFYTPIGELPHTIGSLKVLDYIETLDHYLVPIVWKGIWRRQGPRPVEVLRFALPFGRVFRIKEIESGLVHPCWEPALNRYMHYHRYDARKLDGFEAEFCWRMAQCMNAKQVLKEISPVTDKEHLSKVAIEMLKKNEFARA